MAKQGKRKYQERDLKDIILKVDSGKNVMYQLPTGYVNGLKNQN